MFVFSGDIKKKALKITPLIPPQKKALKMTKKKKNPQNKHKKTTLKMTS